MCIRDRLFLDLNKVFLSTCDVEGVRNGFQMLDFIMHLFGQGSQRLIGTFQLIVFFKIFLCIFSGSQLRIEGDCDRFAVVVINLSLIHIFGMLGLKNASLFLIGRAESFFYYNICQPEELWKQDVLLCDFSGTFLHTLLFTANRKTSPVACFVEEADWKEVAAGRKDLDQRFLETMKAVIGDRNISCVYLIGEGFLGEWYQESLRFLCQERRVFLGNNLYSKGACYAARQRMTPGSVSEDYVFLGKDMLKANISLYVEKRGQDSCHPLLDAGTNWYDAKAEIDFLLEEENRFSLRITPLNGGEIRDVEIALTGLPQRPARTTRIHLQIDMADLTTLRLNMEDFGFGEFFPATHQFWEKTISIGQPDTAAGSSTAAQASAGADTTDTATVASEQSAAGADAKSAAPPVLAES